MINQYKICYVAQWPDGKLLDPNKPYTEAYIVASSKHEAIGNLMTELRGLKVKIVEEPKLAEVQDDV